MIHRLVRGMQERAMSHLQKVRCNKRCDATTRADDWTLEECDSWAFAHSASITWLRRERHTLAASNHVAVTACRLVVLGDAWGTVDC